MVEDETVLRAGMVVAAVLAVVVVWGLDRPRGEWGERLRSRLLLGVPWGTLVLSGLVLSVYLFVQGGVKAWYGPLTLPFASWSYLYPQGMVLAPFSHQGPGHVTGNLLATLVFAPIAEYAMSHFPTRRGTGAFSSWHTNPYVRAFLLFPVGGVAVGLGTSLLHWGPIIGFSGVVFAFAGFALVRYPLLTVAAMVGRRLLGLVLESVRDPIDTVTAGTEFVRPSWADVAVQGHLLGFLLGVLLAFAVVGRRRGGPSALRVLVGATLFGVGTSAWAVWWFRGAENYVLFRGLGVIVVVGMGLLATVAARRWTGTLFEIPRRQVVAVVLFLPLLTMAMVAVPVNLTTVEDNTDPASSVAVRDYTVTYDEGIVNPKTSVFDVEVLNVSSQTPTGGVIVVSERRSLWSQEISPGKLAFSGREFVRVGGAGWRDTVTIRRQGWNVRGGGTAYRVSLARQPPDWKPVYTSDPVTADAVIAGRNVSVTPEDEGFFLTVRGNDTFGRTPIPANSTTATAGGIGFLRDGETVTAVVNETRIPVATRETYD